MIHGEIKPIGHVSPYKRIDPSHPGRRAIITRADVLREGGREPDPSIYRYSPMAETWYLKDGV